MLEHSVGKNDSNCSRDLKWINENEKICFENTMSHSCLVVLSCSEYLRILPKRKTDFA
jgi:hypothetical protein